MAALGRDGNVLGALSLAVADQMSDAVAAAADQSLTAAAALSALEHFADGCSVDRLRRILGLTSSGTVRLVDRLVGRGRRAPPRGTRRAHDEHRAHRGRAARGAPRDRRARRRARGRAGRPLPRRARRPRPPGRARARERGARQARARRGRRVHALDLPAVRPARVRARRGPLPGGERGGRCVARRGASPQGACGASRRKQHHRGRGRRRWPVRARARAARGSATVRRASEGARSSDRMRVKSAFATAETCTPRAICSNARSAEARAPRPPLAPLPR